METKWIVGIFAVVAVVIVSLVALGGISLFTFSVGSPTHTYTSNSGRAVFTVADAAADMGAVTSVKVTVDRLEVQSAARGWETISSSPYTYDLLQLRASGSQALMVDTKLEAGSYGQVRMHISKVMVSDSTGDHEATLPSGDLKIAGGFEVQQNSTTVVTFDFLADKSLHVAGNGRYILAPVVRMQGREDAEVDVSARADVKVMGGRVRTDTEVGMDAAGNMGVGMGIPANADITVSEGSILVRGSSETSGNGAVANGNSIVVPIGGVISTGGQMPGNGAGGAIVADVTACASISEEQARLSCIAQWCGSENRDYNRCYSLANDDDKLGCLNKCNPNSNI